MVLCAYEDANFEAQSKTLSAAWHTKSERIVLVNGRTQVERRKLMFAVTESSN